MAKPVYTVLLVVPLFAILAAGLFAQNVEIRVERANSRIYSGFRERIYIDGRSIATLTNGASGKVSIPPGEHTIHAELYTLTSARLRFNARPGLKFVVTPYSLQNFVIEQLGIDASATGAGRAATVSDRIAQAFEDPADDSVEGTLKRAAAALMSKIAPGSKIAIVYVTARDEEVSEFIAGELEFIMVDRGFTLIDRSQLDRIRNEQQFQMSGEVDDTQAVSIGKIAGANVILTGAVTGSGELRRLRLRALSTETGQVLAVASEKY
jgi:hypothetical protein